MLFFFLCLRSVAEVRGCFIFIRFEIYFNSSTWHLCFARKREMHMLLSLYYTLHSHTCILLNKHTTINRRNIRCAVHPNHLSLSLSFSIFHLFLFFMHLNNLTFIFFMTICTCIIPIVFSFQFLMRFSFFLSFKLLLAFFLYFA